MKDGLSAMACRWSVLLAGAAVLVVVASAGQAQDRSPRLVDVTWLKDRLAQAEMRIIDLRGDVKTYWEGHIPGAVYLNPQALQWPEAGVPVKLAPPQVLTELLGRLGVGPTTLVVAYSEGGDYRAAVLIWALDYLGHQQSAILDGGFAAWTSAGGSMTQDYPLVKAVTYPLPRGMNEAVRASFDEVRQTLGRPEALVVDVRTQDLFSGEKGFWKRQGHIQGAAHRFWGDDLKADGTWKTAAELRAAYEKLGATPDKTILIYCGQGQMSAQTYFTLRHLLGYPAVANYDGGFSEWSNLEDLPVETGGTAAADMEQLLQARCTRCHTLKRVEQEKADRAGWERIIDRMIKKGTKLTDQEREALIDYLSGKRN